MTHLELLTNVRLNKKLFLCAPTSIEFSLENTVAFYELPEVTKLIGTADENLAEIIKSIN